MEADFPKSRMALLDQKPFHAMSNFLKICRIYKKILLDMSFGPAYFGKSAWKSHKIFMFISKKMPNNTVMSKCSVVLIFKLTMHFWHLPV